MKKLILVVPLMIACHAHANGDPINEQLLRNVGEAVFMSLMDAKIKGSCLQQIDARNRTMIANESECQNAIAEFERMANDVADDSAIGRKIIEAAVEYRATYSLAK